MVSKYKQKNSNFRHARLKDHNLYREIIFLSFAKYNTTQIADRLGLPTQTVNRNLKRIREKISSSQSYRSYLIAECNKIDQRQYADLYAQCFDGLTVFRMEKKKNRPQVSDFVRCITECPLGKKPKEFVATELNIFESCGDDVSVFPNIEKPYYWPCIDDPDRMIEYFKRKGKCRFCTLGPDKEGVIDTFSNCTDTYTDLKFYLSYNRIRNKNEYFSHFMYAWTIGLINSYFSCLCIKSDEMSHLEMQLSIHKKFNEMVDKAMEIVAASD